MVCDDKSGARKVFLLELFQGLREIEGRTKLQKILFLGQKELDLPPLFDFSEYYYGPYAGDLTQTLDELVSEGYIEESIESSTDYVKYTYKISESVPKIETESIPKEKIDKLKKISELPRSTIIDYVYRKYLPHRLGLQKQV